MDDRLLILVLSIILLVLILILVAKGRKIFHVITVFEYQRGLKYKKGKFVEVLNPGQYWIFSCNSTINIVDIRSEYITLNGQEVLAADGIPIKVSLAVNYRVLDPVVAIHKTEDYRQALHMVFQLALRDIVGSGRVDEILEKRNILNEKLKESAIEQVNELGLELIGVGIRDISFSKELKRIYTQVLSAQKEGLANLEKARSETAVLRNLANTAKLLENNPALLNLRILQTLGEGSGNTIVLNTPSQDTPLQIVNTYKEE